MFMVAIVMKVGCVRWSFVGLPCDLLPAPPTVTPRRRGSIFGPFSLGKTSPLPLNAGLPDLWRISVILCVGCGVVLPGPVFKVGPPGLFDVYGPLGPRVINSGNGFHCSYI
jgi:hypothetical protein